MSEYHGNHDKSIHFSWCTFTVWSRPQYQAGYLPVLVGSTVADYTYTVASTTANADKCHGTTVSHSTAQHYGKQTHGTRTGSY
eukprot:3941500-Rhodomonas_salina.1